MKVHRESTGWVAYLDARAVEKKGCRDFDTAEDAAVAAVEAVRRILPA